MNSLLPPNATSLERNLEKVAERALDLPTPARSVLDPDTCPAPLLPWLAWALSVSEWDTSWSEAQKRNVIRNAIYIHRHRGTPAGVRLALSSLGYEIDIIEWFQEEPPADPYTFRLDVQLADAGMDVEGQKGIRRIVAEAKNARSHLAGIRLTGVTEGDLFIASALVIGNTTEVSPLDEIELTSMGALYTAGAATYGGGLTVYPG